MKGEGMDEGGCGWSVAARQVGGRMRVGDSIGLRGGSGEDTVVGGPSALY